MWTIAWLVGWIVISIVIWMPCRSSALRERAATWRRRETHD
jgi:hypothetical protein